MAIIDWDEIDKDFENAKAAETDGFSDIPDGSYLVNVERAEKKLSSKKETPYINLSLKILEGPFSGRWCFKKWWFSKNFMPYLKADWELVGFKGSLSDFQDDKALEFFLDLKLNVYVKNTMDREFKNQDVFINGLIPNVSSIIMPHDDEEGPEAEKEDEIPF